MGEVGTESVFQQVGERMRGERRIARAGHFSPKGKRNV